MVEETNGIQHPSLNKTVLEDGTYQQEIKKLVEGDPASWEGVPQNRHVGNVRCVCAQTFRTTFARDLHVHSGLVGSRHDIAPEARPHLSTAWVLFDTDEAIVFRAVMTAGTQRLCSRGRHLESSTSAEHVLSCAHYRM